MKRRYVVGRKKGKKVIVDKLWKPHMLQKLVETTGIIDGKWITLRKVMKICSQKPEEYEKNRQRIKKLVKRGFLKTRKTTLAEKRRLYGFSKVQRPFIYTLGDRAKKILEEYDTFTDENCPLMKRGIKC